MDQHLGPISSYTAIREKELARVAREPRGCIRGNSMTNGLSVRVLLSALVFFLLPASGFAQYGIDDYGYPVEDALAATVVGTPEHLQHELTKKRPRFRLLKLQTKPKEEIPNYFWYHEQYKYLMFFQKKPAPLVFILAGTGGNYSGPNMLYLMKAFYDKGYHAVGLANPTYMNFIINASSTGVVGLPERDTRDLYNVLKRAWTEQLSERIEVTDFYFTGYSLGGTQTGWMAKIDEEEQFFKFKKLLLVNPSVNLYNSVTILDSYFESNIENSDEAVEFWNRLMSAAGELAREEGVQFSDDFLYQLYLRREPEPEGLETLIGIAFRISAQSIMTTADVMRGGGFIIPTTIKGGLHYNVDDYFIVSSRTSFINYFEGLLLPYYQALDPSLTKEDAIYQAGLAPIADYLRTAEHVSVVHNQDDIILKEGEIDWLVDVFGDRAKIWPRGGHLVNMRYKENVEYMFEFFGENMQGGE